MATVLIAVLPARGHVGPTVPAAEALVEAGHTVRVLTGTAYASRFAAVGAAVRLLPSESDFDDTDLTASFPERADLRGIRLARFDLTNFVTAMGPQLAVIDGFLDDVDVVLCDPLLMAGIPLSMRARRPVVLVLGFIPFSIPFPGLPPATTRRERLKDRAVTAIATGAARVGTRRLRRSAGEQLHRRPCPARMVVRSHREPPGRLRDPGIGRQHRPR